MSLFRKPLAPLYVGLLILLIDGISKFLTQTFLPVMNYNWLWYPYGGIGVFKDLLGIDFSISHQINRGAAWGMLANFQVPLLYLRALLIAGLLLYACCFNKNRSLNFPLAFIIAGAFGNVLDYFLYGHVIDMLHFVLWGYDFPVFNLADTSIFIGISWMIALSQFEKHKTKKSPR